MPEGGHSPEQLRQKSQEQENTNASDASQGFIQRWKTELKVGIGTAMTAETGFMTAVHLSQGNEKLALLAALTTAAMGALTAGTGISLARENKAFKQQISQVEKKQRKSI